MGYRLVITNRDTPDREAETKDYDQPILTVGRHSSNDIQIVHPGASRQHCKIVFEDGNYFLIDPGSANGTMLNGRKIPLKRNQLLKDNDVIGVESYEIRYKKMSRVAVKGPGENTDEVALRVVREVLGSLQSKSNPFLEVISGPNKGKVIEFDKDVMQILIGRSEACDLVLNDPMISRRNTKIKRDWSGVTITDLNSKNGTFVNNEKISEKVLKDGDEFRIGESRGFFRNPKESFGREAEEESEPLAAAVPDQPVISRPEPYPTMAKTPPLPPAPAPARPYTPPPAFQPPPSAIEPSALGEREPEYDYEPAGFLKTMKPIDYVIIGVGIVIFIGCIVVLLKILF